MSTDGFSLKRLMSNVAGIALTATLVGCASAPSSADPVITIPDNSQPKDSVTCGVATPTSGVTTIAAAGIGHLLDKKTGGGRGFEKSFGSAVWALTAPCVTKPPEAAATSTAVPASAPVFIPK